VGRTHQIQQDKCKTLNTYNANFLVGTGNPWLAGRVNTSDFLMPLEDMTMRHLTFSSIFLSFFLFLSAPLFAAHHDTGHSHITAKKNGLVNLKSNHNVKMTADKLVDILKKKGMTVFARIDHAAGAKKVDEELRPTELVIFGNPKVGTPLMRCAQTVAIDLPQKMLIWQDAAGSTWLSYNDPSYLMKRHKIVGCDPVIKKVSGALKNFANAAAK
jgi:uncharacterized protein (DUF302 family)